MAKRVEYIGFDSPRVEPYVGQPVHAHLIPTYSDLNPPPRVRGAVKLTPLPVQVHMVCSPKGSTLERTGVKVQPMGRNPHRATGKSNGRSVRRVRG
jgi:hypothetical protein